MSQVDSVSEFWGWFTSKADEIRDAYRSGDATWLDRQITPRVLRIEENLNWEIGPYHDPDDTFVLSPTVRENLALTRSAIACAPNLDGWRFLPAKPPKELKSLTFLTGGDELNADEWRYQLTSYNDGEFVDIEIFVNKAADLPNERLDILCELVVESLVGEELRLDRIGNITPTVIDEMQAVQGLTLIPHLPDHLAMVLSPSQGQE